jgi:assimilatory nitrate reductase catalytic subunit
VTSTEQRPGSIFAPIHWNGQVSGQARVGVLVDRVVDPLSGQPEFKHAPVALAPYPAAWHGFVLARQPLDWDKAGYWTQIRAKACWRIELAGPDDPAAWPQRLHEAYGQVGDWIELKDWAARRYRAAFVREGHLEMVCFFERDAAALPPRHWLEALFGQDRLSHEERTALLMGRPSKSVPDCGRIVCACFGVGENDLKRAIVQGAKSVEALGIELKAGTNCGSCIPELKQLLATP